MARLFRVERCDQRAGWEPVPDEKDPVTKQVTQINCFKTQSEAKLWMETRDPKYAMRTKQMPKGWDPR